MSKTGQNKTKNREQASPLHANTAPTFMAGRTGGDRSIDESPGPAHWPAVVGRTRDSSHTPPKRKDQRL